MLVKVSRCWAGHDNHYYRCDLPTGERIIVGSNSEGRHWCRAFATELRDHVMRITKVRRDSIRVQHD